jgi:hypothetical protein
VRGAGAGARVRQVVGDRIGALDRRRAVGDDRAALIGVTEILAEAPGLTRHRRHPLADRREIAPRGRRAGVEHAFRALLADLGVHGGDAAPLGLVGVEQALAGNAAQHGRELPDQVVRRLQVGVHAEAACRRGAMRGVADQQHAALAKAQGDLGRHHPKADGADLDRGVGGAGGLAHEVDGHGLGEVLGAVLGLEIQMQEPQIAAVHRDIAAADGLAQDVVHERLAVAEAGAEIRMVIDVDEVPHVAGACAGDLERLAHAARGAVGGQEIAGARARCDPSPGLGWLP